MIFAEPPIDPGPLRERVRAATDADETAAVEALLREAQVSAEARARIEEDAARLVSGLRETGGKRGLDAFLQEYSLSSEEGVVLMCLAEALLRIPDAGTADLLIRDKLTGADFARHLGRSDSLLVNASTYALMLTGRIIGFEALAGTDPFALVKKLAARSGEPVIRQAVTAAMRILGRQFVMGRDIAEALERAAAGPAYRYSFDMLGEAARTRRDAERYFDAYAGAIAAIGKAAAGADPVKAPSLSVKLSALHPRFEPFQSRRAGPEIAAKLRELAKQARDAGIGLMVDAEEAERLDFSLDVFDAAASDLALSGWDGLGLAVQAYQKRGRALIDWLEELAARTRRRLAVRLVKGAYWDSEIKRGQERGLPDYPVFTRKANTDVSYLACAMRLLRSPRSFFPQFATHNAHTAAAVMEFAGRSAFEFQRLHGMGQALYDQILARGHACRVYAPVGPQEELLPYLVRRLLENGANTSFVNRLGDAKLPVSEVVADPFEKAKPPRRHPRIPVPADLFMPERRNSRGLDLSDPSTLSELAAGMAPADWPGFAVPMAAGKDSRGRARKVTNPADRDQIVGEVAEAGGGHVDSALAAAVTAAPDWDAVGADRRARCLEAAADRFEREYPALIRLIVREGGRTVPDALSEAREAVDFLRYFAARARAEFGAESLPGPTGEKNTLSLHGRGVFACISPWNFPLSIFTGQIAAALAAGNAAIAKPAQQTPLIAAAAVRLLHEAGVPEDVLQLLPGSGAEVGGALVRDPRLAGVALTGSVATAHSINRALAAREGPIPVLIAETGGQNAMIVDSSALAEQVVADAVTSAFDSAGQRCSALRVLFLQADVAPRIVEMLTGAMAELAVGDPALIETDVGPVIDASAAEKLSRHAARMEREGKLLYQVPLGPQCARGTFFAPRAFEIPKLSLLTEEVFGPILHVIRFEASRLDEVIAAVNATGFGLTLGIHSRIESTISRIQSRARVGNIYVNRNMIGAVVGAQPFGGEGLSGTGPKTGGPHYLSRFALERTLSVNTAATGGNAALLSLEEDQA
jgi:RHH-type proline utilization regulon transcriptional repressor/proline dehydrogenase/delta 1-pyrroline-5-carboxylate dehydrogenase